MALDILSQYFSLVESIPDVPVAAPRTRTVSAPVEEAVSSFDADAVYECRCGQPLVNWVCPVKCAADLPFRMKRAA